MAATLNPEELVIGEGWLIAHYPRVQCAYFGPKVSDRSFEDYLERLVKDIQDRPNARRTGVLYYAENADMDSPRRRRMAKVLDEHEDKLTRSTAAYALATSSPFVRGVLTTLFWLAPPGYPYKIVGTPEQGLAFIAEHLRGVDPQRIAASFMSLLDTQLRKAS